MGWTPTDDKLFFREYGPPGDHHVVPNVDFIKQHFLKEGRLTEKQALYILDRATAILSREPNLVNVGSPVTSEFTSSLLIVIDANDARVSLPDSSQYAGISMANT